MPTLSHDQPNGLQNLRVVATRRVRRGRDLALLLWHGSANVGWCPICEKRTVFLEEGTWLRDEYRCLWCRSIPRYRALLTVLGDVIPDWRARDLYEIAPYGPASEKLERECGRYMSSHYFPDAASGTLVAGVRCENLEALTFEDASFDIVVTQDVFEHVLRPERGFSEIARTLRPGGMHVFTVPYYFQREESLVRALPGADGGVEHVEPADYHGNPVDGSGSLVIREWGRDLCDFVLDRAQMTTTIYHAVDRRRGLDGEFLEVFVSVKR